MEDRREQGGERGQGIYEKRREERVRKRDEETKREGREKRSKGEGERYGDTEWEREKIR